MPALPGHGSLPMKEGKKVGPLAPHTGAKLVEGFVRMWRSYKVTHERSFLKFLNLHKP